MKPTGETYFGLGIALVSTVIATIALLAMIALRDEQAVKNYDPNIVAIRCAVHVYEDGSATWEDGDQARDECYRRLTGQPLFQPSDLPFRD